MKKIILLLTVIILSMSILVSCDIIGQIIGTPDVDITEKCEHVDADDDYFCDKCGDTYFDDDEVEEEPKDEEPEEKPEEPEENPEEKPEDNDSDKQNYTYTSFTPAEKTLFNQMFGEVIPFIANNEYYVEEYSYEYDDYYEEGINFYTYGNTKAEFNAYKALFSTYTYEGTDTDDYGDAWYFYSSSEGYYIDLSYYYGEDSYIIDVYVYFEYDYDDDGGDSGNNGGNGDNNNYLYTDFTSEEKALIKDFLGELIPFAPNNEYYVEIDTDYYGDEYLAFYTYGNNEDDFNEYFLSFDNYELLLEDSFEDEYGDMWYCLEKGDIYIMMSFYYYGGDYVIDVYAYYTGENSNNGGNGENGGNGGNGGTITTPDNLITNAGAGLPTGNSGVYDVDFTDATKVKDVTDQSYYLDGCPTTGSPKVLVIPVDFTDIMGSRKGYSIDNILRAFTGGTGTTDYYSVHDYYYISSYGQLDLDITVINEWFIPKNPSTYYANATYDYYGDQVMIGDQLVMDEALAYLSTFMDLSIFDSDGNAIIDAVVLVTTLEIDAETDFYWAYRYWNIYTDDEGYYYEYDGVSANDYLWASYSFMHESYDNEGYSDYTDTSVMNTYTYIHEMGHILGIDDYYDYSARGNHPLDGCDIMDSMLGDHNAYTKFNLGWITASRLVTTSSSVTLTLEAFTKSGDTIIIANNFDPDLGVYQEYYIVVYYTSDGLNGQDAGYFARDGIVVYHVNASLYSEEYYGEIYYDIYNSNTDPSDEYGTEDNLIEFVKSASDTFTYVAGDSLPSVTDDQGNKLSYDFTVDSINGDVATITFTKR